MSRLLACLVTFTALGPLPAPAQFGGSRAGVDPGGFAHGLPTLPPEVATRYITVEGRVEIRVAPTELRVVLAVTGEGETANDCRNVVDARIGRILAAWEKRGVDPETVVQDFIAVLPRYEWAIEKRGAVEVGIENLVGYRMQTNLHLAVPTEAAARTALDDAFSEGVTDIIAFDYWSRELDAARTRARAAAVKAARDKAAVLLAVFDEPPRVVNVQERTEVHAPTSLYHSFENANAERVSPPYRREMPFIRASQPKNTYYRGLVADADVSSPNLPMRPELSVVSTVRLYFLSPAADLFAPGNARAGHARVE